MNIVILWFELTKILNTSKILNGMNWSHNILSKWNDYLIYFWWIQSTNKFQHNKKNNNRTRNWLSNYLKPTSNASFWCYTRILM